MFVIVLLLLSLLLYSGVQDLIDDENEFNGVLRQWRPLLVTLFMQTSTVVSHVQDGHWFIYSTRSGPDQGQCVR